MEAQSELRARRQASGLTQAQLGERAGVSRQLVAAVEAGRNVPAVDAALALAAALGCTVEDLFGALGPERQVRPALTAQLADGAPVRVGRVADTLVVAPLGDHGVAGTGWATADAVVRQGRLELFAGAAPAGLVLAGCEPALGIAERLLSGLGDRSLMVVSGSTGSALEALEAGRVHGAVVHGPPRSMPAAPSSVLRLHFARWQVGLATAARSRAVTVESLLSGSLPIAQREPGAASQQALDRARRRAGVARTPRGPLATGHIDAARTAATLRCAGLTTEGAARAFDLSFIALEEHSVELWLDRRWAEHPGAQAVGELIRSSGFQQRIGRLGGYDLTGCGDSVAGT